MEIRHLQHHQIDKDQWNQRVAAVPGGILYAYSWYLDAVTPGWQALVTTDYFYLMPLTARQKFGFRYLYQPLLTQQLGVISAGAVESEMVSAFIDAIPAEFRLIEITLNERNPVPAALPFAHHVTLRLDLSPTYEQLSALYSENTRRNLKKATPESLTFESGIPIGSFLDLLHQDTSMGSRILLKLENRKPLLKLITTLLARDAGEICGVRTVDGTLVAAALFAQQGTMRYYLAPGSLESGREARAMFYLIDRYILLHSGTPGMLDFEGSDLPTVARFYQGFGAAEHQYPSYRLNRLPWPLKNLADRRMR